MKVLHVLLMSFMAVSMAACQLAEEVQDSAENSTEQATEMEDFTALTLEEQSEEESESSADMATELADEVLSSLGAAEGFRPQYSECPEISQEVLSESDPLIILITHEFDDCRRRKRFLRHRLASIDGSRSIELTYNEADDIESLVFDRSALVKTNLVKTGWFGGQLSIDRSVSKSLTGDAIAGVDGSFSIDSQRMVTDAQGRLRRDRDVKGEAEAKINFDENSEVESLVLNGSFTVEHKLAEVVVEREWIDLTFTSGCYYPTSGTILITIDGNVRSLQFDGCKQ